MTKLLEIKEIIKSIFAKYDTYLLPASKFFFALIAFATLNSKIGFMTFLKNPFIILVLALACSFLPLNAIVVISAFLTVMHLFALSFEAAIVGTGLLLIMLTLYFAFDSKHAFALIATPLAFVWNIPCAIPLAFGLSANPVSAIAMCSGVIVYYFLGFIVETNGILSSDQIDDAIKRLNFLVEGITKNKMMFITLVAFITVLAIVYIIRRQSLDYAWTIAIATGSITYILVMLVGDFALDITNNIFTVFLGTIFSAAIAFGLKFFIFNVDYTRTESLQFEDDEYYYFVKAVPKISISAPNFRVQRIQPQKKKVKKAVKKDRRPADIPEQDRIFNDEIYEDLKDLYDDKDDLDLD